MRAGVRRRPRAATRAGGGAAGGARRRAPQPEQRRQRASHEHRLGPGVRAVVDPADVAAQQHRHEDGRHQRRNGRDNQDPPNAAAGQPPPPQQRDDDERPDQIELLLNRQRPGVAQRRRGRALGEIPALGPELTPVADVAEGRQPVQAQREARLGLDQERRVYRHRGEDEEQRGKQPACPSGPERSQRDTSRRLLFPQQEHGDQVAGQDEEDVHAQEPAPRSRDPAVEEQDGDDRNSAQPVERGLASGQPRGHRWAGCAGRLIRASRTGTPSESRSRSRSRLGVGAGDGDGDGDGAEVPRGAPRRTDRMFRPSRQRLAHHRVGPQRVSARLGPYKQPMGPFADRDASENRTVGGRHRVHR